MISFQTAKATEEGVSIVGVGGAGANILKYFASSSSSHIKMNLLALDERLGDDCSHANFIPLGRGVSHGMGSGGDPALGAKAAEASREDIAAILQNLRLMVLIVGLGGGTGSGVAPTVAKMAREAGVFVVTVAVMPFKFEGPRRREQADNALAQLRHESHILFCFENDLMEDLFKSHSGVRAVFEEADRLLARAAASVPMLDSSPGLIKMGLDDLHAVLDRENSRCLFGAGAARGENRAVVAAEAALNSPLLHGEKHIPYLDSILVHIAGSESMSIEELRHAMEHIQSAYADRDLDIYFGASVKPHLGDEIRITIIAALDEQGYVKSMTPQPKPEIIPVLSQPEPEAELALAPQVEVAAEPELVPVPDFIPVLDVEPEIEIETEIEPAVELEAEVELEPVMEFEPEIEDGVDQVEVSDDFTSIESEDDSEEFGELLSYEKAETEPSVTEDISEEVVSFEPFINEQVEDAPEVSADFVNSVVFDIPSESESVESDEAAEGLNFADVFSDPSQEEAVVVEEGEAEDAMQAKVEYFHGDLFQANFAEVGGSAEEASHSIEEEPAADALDPAELAPLPSSVFERMESQSVSEEDDLDLPPSLRHNDLRKIFNN